MNDKEFGEWVYRMHCERHRPRPTFRDGLWCGLVLAGAVAMLVVGVWL
jgi:hypothetical protein